MILNFLSLKINSVRAAVKGEVLVSSRYVAVMDIGCERTGRKPKPKPKGLYFSRTVKLDGPEIQIGIGIGIGMEI